MLYFISKICYYIGKCEVEMANYSDNPSMDEILRRIKKALAERERKASAEDEQVLEDDSVVAFTNREAESDLKKSQDIFIKPNVKTNEPGVFVLTKDMKLNSMARLSDVNFQQFCSNLSDKMAKDLSIAYMGPKMEDWLLNNFWEVVASSSKKNFD